MLIRQSMTYTLLNKGVVSSLTYLFAVMRGPSLGKTACYTVTDVGFFKQSLLLQKQQQ